MSLDKIIKTLKEPKEEMSAISFNIPLRLKTQLTDLAKENAFTTNAFLVAMIDNILNGEARDKKKIEIVEKLEKLYARKLELETMYGVTEEDNGFVDSMGEGLKYKSELESISHMIELLKEI